MTQSPTDLPRNLAAKIAEARRLAALVGVVGIALCLAAWILVMILDHRWSEGATAFYKAYLFAWLFFLGVSLGAMAAVMLHVMTGGEWGYFVRRLGEHAANVLPLLFVLFVPILVGLHRIYPWADPRHQDQPVIAHKRAYLNTPFFIGRYVFYFAVWMLMAWLLRSRSLRRDHTAGDAEQRQLRVVSAVGLVIYVITMSFAAVDWIMSLEPGWYSTVFGFVVCLGQAISGTCVLIITLQLLSGDPPFAPRLRPRHFNDLGTLLITVVILWAYNAFSQFLIIWLGNIHGEITWYVKRTYGGWRVLFWVLIFLGFLAPFVLLLQRGVKQRGRAMLWLCCFLLLMRWIDIYWMVTPSGDEPHPGVYWFNIVMSFVALAGIGGLWIFAYLWLMDGPPLMPMGEKVPIEVIPPDVDILQPRTPDHGAEPGTTSPGIA